MGIEMGAGTWDARDYLKPRPRFVTRKKRGWDPYLDSSRYLGNGFTRNTLKNRRQRLNDLRKGQPFPFSIRFPLANFANDGGQEKSKSFHLMIALDLKGGEPFSEFDPVARFFPAFTHGGCLQGFVFLYGSNRKNPLVFIFSGRYDKHGRLILIFSTIDDDACFFFFQTHSSFSFLIVFCLFLYCFFCLSCLTVNRSHPIDINRAFCQAEPVALNMVSSSRGDGKK